MHTALPRFTNAVSAEYLHTPCFTVARAEP